MKYLLLREHSVGAHFAFEKPHCGLINRGMLGGENVKSMNKQIIAI